MKYYRIYEFNHNNKIAYKAVRHGGFSWLAFFFSGFWLLLEKFWTLAIFYWFVAVIWIFITASILPENAFYEDVYISQREAIFYMFSLNLQLIIYGVIHVCLGFYGSSLIESKFLKSGGNYVGLEEAIDIKQAIDLYKNKKLLAQ